MLEVQKAIRSHGLEHIVKQLALRVYKHPNEPLVGLKYNQIDSPRTHPIVREARGLVLHSRTFDIVAKPFNRFFNVGELQEEFKQFNWDDFTCVTKEDGSLIILYWYDGAWRVNTSGSFGLGAVQSYDITWEELFWKHADFDIEKLSKRHTYLWELCTPYNMVVKTYKEPRVFLIGVNNTITGDSFKEHYVDEVAKYIEAARPKTFNVAGKDEVKNLLLTLDGLDEVHEGVVLHDSNGLRYKWKTKGYLELHKLADNGNILKPHRLLSIVLSNKDDDVSAIFPVKGALNSVKDAIRSEVDNLWNYWFTFGDLRSRKKFAMRVKDQELSWILFKLYNEDWDGSESETRDRIYQELYDNSDKVAKSIFGNKIFEFDK